MNTQVSDQQKDRIHQTARILYENSRSIRILRTIAWPSGIKEEFFAQNAKELPKVSYTSLDPAPVLDLPIMMRSHCVHFSPNPQPPQLNVPKQ